METTLSVVIPVFNEALNIGRVLDEIKTKVKTPNNILIVYDFDEDDSIPAVKKWIKANPDSNIALARNKSKGVLEAIKTGFYASKDPLVLVVMADLSDDLSRVDEMVAKINEGYDIVCGSRYMRGGRQIGGPLVKRTLSRLAGLSLFYITGIPTHDATNSFKLYKKDVLDNINMQSNGGFELGMEITIKAFLNGFKITEVPTTWVDRTTGKSRFKFFVWLPKYIKWYLLALTSIIKKTSKTSQKKI